MPNIACVRSEVVHRGQTYPIFTGSLEANQLYDLAYVPSYDPADGNSTIATRLWEPLYDPGAGAIAMGAAAGITRAPVTDRWQRPQNPGKVANIQLYHANRDQIMSNPIILAAKDPLPGGANIVPNIVAGSPQAGSLFCNLEITRAPGNGNEPLLIIDGQHRLSGLNRGATVNEKIPFILLFDDIHHIHAARGNNIYTPEYIAETFGIVSTTPTMLDEPHSSWMQFTFGLPEPARYEPPGAVNLRKAFETGLWLGSQPQFPSAAVIAAGWAGGGPRPNVVFCDRIGFNPDLPFGFMDAGGFGWQIHNLGDIINDWYYEPGGPLDPELLARQISWAVEALRAWDPNQGRDSRLFPGPGTSGIKPMILGIFRGLLEFIRTNGPLADYDAWQDLIRDNLVNPGRGAPLAGAPVAGAGIDWTFPGVRMPVGDETVSSQRNWTRDISRNCLLYYLNGVRATDFMNYLFGTDAEIRITASLPTPARRPRGPGAYDQDYSVPVGAKNSILPVVGAAFDMQNGVGAAPYREIIHVESMSQNMIVRARFVSVEVGGVTYDATGLANTQNGFDVASLGAALPAGGFGAGGGMTFTIAITNFTGRTERYITRTVTI